MDISLEYCYSSYSSYSSSYSYSYSSYSSSCYYSHSSSYYYSSYSSSFSPPLTLPSSSILLLHLLLLLLLLLLPLYYPNTKCGVLVYLGHRQKTHSHQHPRTPTHTPQTHVTFSNSFLLILLRFFAVEEIKCRVVVLKVAHLFSQFFCVPGFVFTCGRQAIGVKKHPQVSYIVRRHPESKGKQVEEPQATALSGPQHRYLTLQAPQLPFSALLFR